MSAKNPISDDIRRKIQLCAYHIWEREGRPEGRQHEHWQMAEAEILGDKPASKPVAAKPNGNAKTAKPKNGSTAIKSSVKPGKSGPADKANPAGKPKKTAKSKSAD